MPSAWGTRGARDLENQHTVGVKSTQTIKSLGSSPKDASKPDVKSNISYQSGCATIGTSGHQATIGYSRLGGSKIGRGWKALEFNNSGPFTHVTLMDGVPPSSSSHRFFQVDSFSPEAMSIWKVSISPALGQPGTEKTWTLTYFSFLHVGSPRFTSISSALVQLTMALQAASEEATSC